MKVLFTNFFGFNAGGAEKSSSLTAKALEEKGAVFVESLEEVPEGSRLIFSAHGVPPKAREEAEARKLKVIDATCPLVTKVHMEARRYAKEGCSIILVGHKDHVEIEGTAGEAPEAGAPRAGRGPAAGRSRALPERWPGSRCG